MLRVLIVGHIPGTEQMKGERSRIAEPTDPNLQQDGLQSPAVCFFLAQEWVNS